MGLDANLYRRVYLKDDEGTRLKARVKHINEQNKDILPALFQEDYAALETFANSPASYVEEDVKYWRKANQIHKWFLDHAPEDYDYDTEDDIEVSYQDLKELCETCEMLIEKLELVPGQIHAGTVFKAGGGTEEQYQEGLVVKNQELAEQYMPTMSGFFFGDTNYTEYYVNDLKETVEALKPMLEKDSPDDWCVSYIYRMSW